MKSLKSVFFGGGTPSLADASMVSSVLEAATSVCSLTQDAEISLEVNPTSEEASKLKYV